MSFLISMFQYSKPFWFNLFGNVIIFFDFLTLLKIYYIQKFSSLAGYLGQYKLCFCCGVLLRDYGLFWYTLLFSLQNGNLLFACLLSMMYVCLLSLLSVCCMSVSCMPICSLLPVYTLSIVCQLPHCLLCVCHHDWPEDCLFPVCGMSACLLSTVYLSAICLHYIGCLSSACLSVLCMTPLTSVCMFPGGLLVCLSAISCLSIWLTVTTYLNTVPSVFNKSRL